MDVRSPHIPLFRGGGPTMRKIHKLTRAKLPWFSDSAVDTNPVGVAAVVTCGVGGQVELWAIGLREPLRRAGLLHEGVTTSLSETTKAEIKALIARLSDWLAALWQPSLPNIRDLVCVPIDAVNLEHPGSTVSWSGLVQGPSIQAAALLAVASWMAKHALPPDLLVSSGVACDTGALVRMEGLDPKKAGLAHLAPKLSRLIGFGAEDSDPPTFRALLEDVGIQGALLGWGMDSPGHSVATIEAIAAAGSTTLPSFTAVSNAATTLLERQLTGEQRARVRFAQAIVDRHDNRAANMPDWAELAQARALVHPLDASCIEQLAHAVQHHTDRGEGLPNEVSLLATRLVSGVNRHDTACWPSSIKLLGALGRNASVDMTDAGRQAALEMQIHACEAWKRHRLFAEMTYPLSEGYRLAGALGDLAAFERVEALRTEWEESARARTDDNGTYVDLAAGRARTLLHESKILTDDGQIFELLDPIATLKPTTQSKLVFASRRWLRRTCERVAPEMGDGEQYVLAMLDEVVSGRRSPDETPALLCRLREVAQWASSLRDPVDLVRLTRGSPY